MEELYRKAAEKIGLSYSAYAIFYGLYSKKCPATQKELCEEWGINKQTINSSVKKMVSEGLLEVNPSPENSREKLVSFTENGKKFAENRLEKLIEAEQNAFLGFTEEEQEAAVKLSEKAVALYRKEFSKLIGDMG